jgi:CheY-like chemotaxis protein
MIHKILLAEDNALNQKLLLHGLKQYQVDVARDGEEAIELFRTNQYDIVLMDIQMPGIDGLEASRQIRRIEDEKDQHTRAIILGITADWFPNLKEECKAAGIDDFLAKPFQPSNLGNMITDYYSRYTH